MKKFILSAIAILFFVATSFHADAQATKRIIQADTSINTTGTTLTFQNMPSHLKTLQVTVTRISGTAAGNVFLEGTVDGNWLRIDTMALSNQVTNTKKIPISKTEYYHYRFVYVPSGTQTSRMQATYLRRADEN